MTTVPKLFKKGLHLSKMLFVFATVLSLLGVTNLLISTPKEAKAALVPFIADTNPAHQAIGAGGFSFFNHSLAIRSDGTAWAWGSGGNGQLGNGSLSNKLTATQAAGLSDMVAVEGGGRFSVGLKSDGTVWVWGDDLFGALDSATKQSGCGSFGVACSPNPVQVPGLTNVKAIAAGFAHVLALKLDGTVWAWGDNRRGQLGYTSTETCDFGVPCSKTPKQVSVLSDVVAIAGGRLDSWAVKSDGTLWAWGGDSILSFGGTPVQVSGISDVKDFKSVHGFGALALKKDGTVWAWGANGSGQLGDGTSANINLTPRQVAGLAGVTAIATGGVHALALKSDRTVWAWGGNFSGQLGYPTSEICGLIGSQPCSTRPNQVNPSLSDVVAIAADASHSLAVKADGTTWAWGYNGSGQLGDGTLFSRTTPTQVMMLPLDRDGDGVPDSEDNCPDQPGNPAYQGCISGAKAHVDLTNITSGQNTASVASLGGARVRAFDRNSTAFLNVTGGKMNPPPSLYATIFESGASAGLVGQFGECQTDGAGNCTVGLFSSTGDYLEITKYRDPSGKIAYVGKEFGTNDFDTAKLASNNYAIIRVQTPKEVQLAAAGKFTVTGSMLEVTYPTNVVWGGENPVACEGMDSSSCPVDSSSALYPFIFKSDSDWTVDVCASVPTGYSIVGYYDEAGNLVSGTSCTQTLVANTAKTVVFKATETGSPEPSFEATLKLKDPKGKVTEKKLKTDDIRQKTVDEKVKEAQGKAKGQAAAPASGKRLPLLQISEIVRQITLILQALQQMLKELQ